MGRALLVINSTAERQKAVKASRIRECLDYNSDTGVFVWKKRLSNRKAVGAVAGHLSAAGYVQIGIDGRLWMAHQLAWTVHYGEFPDMFIDHIDGDRANNAIGNLRLASNSQNGMNRGAQANNPHGLKGIHHHANGRWRAQIACGGKRRHIGYFDTKEAAHEAYSKAASELFGEFARPACREH